MRNKAIAVILGGGQGTRLFPLTKLRSKPAVPIAGKYRLVDIPISNCLNSDIRRIYVLTQFNSASLNRHIKNTYNFDVFSSGFVDILAAEQTPQSDTWYQGTADAVRQSIHHMENHPHEHVFVLSGDQLYQMDYRKMMAKHEASNADLTVATIPVVAKHAPQFGIMKTNNSGVIEGFTEKPDPAELDQWKSDTQERFQKDGRVYLASMGIYIFQKEVLTQMLDQYADSTDFGKEIIPSAIADDFNIHSYEFDGYWRDIGTVKSFFEANLALTDDLPKFNLYDNDDFIYTHARMLPASKLSGTTFANSILAEGCIIEANKIEHSVVGIRSRIGQGTTIEDAIIMGNDFFPSDEMPQDTKAAKPQVSIGERCFISNAIIDKNCIIGDDVRIIGGDHLEDGEYENYHVVDGIVIVPKNSVIEDGTEI
ncbi:glucose-1-phosphate adenylyltransferase [Fodinibius salinus]|uniref:Glucose-1-phosphate adenylyltransferase n=1 Tax=Fodinibius salinus TaxID=860790 RepID=A0A5D3YM49_9BACT|nr:glucose-1-phosphate adenylyltransferase [Fodinibius salinus]TYP94917.1 glucose-1-phosphate adenylyltransferase [Fodinibius salinus]